MRERADSAKESWFFESKLDGFQHGLHSRCDVSRLSDVDGVGLYGRLRMPNCVGSLAVERIFYGMSF
jgi:hypothetical protein